MEILSLILSLFFTFFVIGAFTFGGGYAMLSLIQAQVVTANGWISESTFADIVAISQMTPGPIGINCATFVGYDVLSNAGAGPVLSILGSLSTTMGLVLPSFIIMMALLHFYNKARQSDVFERIMKGVRPAVAGLIGAAAVTMMTEINFPDTASWILFAAAFVASFKFKINPIVIILAAAAIGLLTYFI